ncbi:LCI fold-containing protein [Photorhabdus hainanensis]|uniref:LCI fold-containing protein n=1 Tax=Photorhabdus hainanensis TaxID=1004166 RepID=UPI001BD61DC1|nr:LCI fold-containing protein [Photorhabdus hainanensis]MBS9433557.1 hypothetical protein [Photorhabdus hainanensis]
MFKKLLVVGALVSGIALTGGIGVASANVDINWNNCYNSPISYNDSTRIYTKYEVKNGGQSSFSNKKTENGITWYFKGIKKLDHCGSNYHVGKYEGRR